MIDGARIREFWAQWNHEPDTTEEFSRFRTRVKEIAKDIWRDYVQRSKYTLQSFAVFSGTPFTGDSFSSGTPFSRSELCDLLDGADNVFQVAQAVQFLLWTLEAGSLGGLRTCCDQLRMVFDLSPTVPIQIVYREGATASGATATLYRTGAKLLDEAVVETSLIWLARYPRALKPFEEALKLYAGKDPNQYRGMLDNLRFSVEQMLRAVLNNEKGLENQKEEFLLWLKDHDAHGHIGQMYHELLFKWFTQYQNEAVKHKEDTYTPAEVEFVLYLTGTFLRFIQRLVEQEAATKATATS